MGYICSIRQLPPAPPACTLIPRCKERRGFPSEVAGQHERQEGTMKRTVMLPVALFLGSSLAMAQMPLEGVGTKHIPPSPAARAHGIAFPGNPEGLGVPRVEIFGAYSLAIPAPSWGLPSNTRGIGMDTSASINLNRWFAAESDFAWNRAWADFSGITVTDRSMLFSVGPRVTYRQGRLGVFAH